MSTKPIVEGGLLTAISVILGLASIYLPFFGLIIEFFCAVPIVVLSVRQGAAKGFVALTASFILLTIFVGPILSIRNALSFGVCGLILGWCINKGFGAVKSFVATLIAAFISQLIVIGIVTFVMEIDVLDTELTAVRETFEESFKVYEDIGVDEKAISQARAQVEPTLELTDETKNSTLEELIRQGKGKLSKADQQEHDVFIKERDNYLKKWRKEMRNKGWTDQQIRESEWVAMLGYKKPKSQLEIAREYKLKYVPTTSNLAKVYYLEDMGRFIEHNEAYYNSIMSKIQENSQGQDEQKNWDKYL